MAVVRISLLLAVLDFVGGQLQDNTLQRIVDDFWLWRLENVPEFASNVNYPDFQDQVESYSLDAFRNRKLKVDGYLRQLGRINRRTLSNSDRVTYDVLVDTLQIYSDGYRWKDYGPMTPFNFLGGQQTDEGKYIGMNKFANEQDYRNFLSRVSQITQRIYDSMERMNVSIEKQTTNHNVSMSRVIGQIDSILATTPTTNQWYTPFTQQLDELLLPETTTNELKTSAEYEITKYLEAMADLKDYLINVYMPNTRPEYGVWSLTDGDDYYKACLKWHLSLDITAEQVHEMGLREVERISAEMRRTMDELEFTGTMREFFDDLRSRPEFILDSSDEIIEQFRKVINERVGKQLALMFDGSENFPEIQIDRMTYDGPVAIYKNGAPDGSRNGTFYVNTFDRDNNPTYSIPVLALHEGNPGHHIQDFYALTSKNLPAFRRSTDFTKYWAVPLHFPFYTAYSEGWALYAEYLGDEMEIYEDAYERMGRYSSEIFRACRLVVDTGIHHFRWSRQEAIDYMLNYTANHETLIAREIDRYITWPGQATSYKVGGLKFKEIRQRAIDALAPSRNFDLKEFHFLVLDAGAMPLSVMEDVVDDWIADKKKKHCIDMDPKECPTASAATNQFNRYISVSFFMLALKKVF